jgi:hypothetical protein
MAGVLSLCELSGTTPASYEIADARGRPTLPEIMWQSRTRHLPRDFYDVRRSSDCRVALVVM